MNLPTGPRGRILALLLLLATLSAAYLVVVVPVLDLYREREAQAEGQRALLAKFDAVARQLLTLQARLAGLRTAIGKDKLTVSGASDSVASASLQARIEQFAASAGLRVGSTEVLPVKQQGGYHRIGLRLLVSGSYESLLRLLGGIQTAVPPLVVDDLQVRTLQRRPGLAPTVGLDASLEVYGFRDSGMVTAAKP